MGEASYASEDVLIIQKRQQTVHAIAPETGSERWNFSVGQHDIRLVKTSECHQTKEMRDSLNFKIETILPEGRIYAVSDQDQILWTQTLESPIVSVWHYKNGDLKLVDVFKNSHWSWSLSDNNFPSIYVGMHKKQLYIQESDALHNLALYHSNQRNLLEQKRPVPRIPWKPFVVSSLAVTALANVDNNDTQITQSTQNELMEIGTTSLAVLYASKYINGKSKTRKKSFLVRFQN